MKSKSFTARHDTTTRACTMFQKKENPTPTKRGVLQIQSPSLVLQACCELTYSGWIA
jgi:hypothetical protein